MSPELMLAATRGPQVEDMQTVAARGMNLGNLMQARALNQLQMQHQQTLNQQAQIGLQQAQQGQQDQEKVRQAFLKAGHDPKAYREELLKISPAAVANFDSQQAKYAEELAKADELKLKNDAERGEQMRGYFQGFMQHPVDYQQANWQNFLNGAMKKGITQEELLAMPTTYPGKDWMLAHSNGYAHGSKLVQEEIDRRTAAAHEKTAQTAADRLAAELPEIQAKNFSSQLMNAAKTLGTVQDQAGYDAWLKTLPSDQLRQWSGATFSPQRKDAILMAAVGPAEAARLKREADALAEQQRHNKTTEGLEQRRFNATLGAGLDANGQPLPQDAEEWV